MQPETVRDFILLGMADLVRADELITGVLRRRQHADSIVLGDPHLLHDDEFNTSIRLAHRAISRAQMAQRRLLDAQVGYLRDTAELGREFSAHLRDLDDLDEDVDAG